MRAIRLAGLAFILPVFTGCGTIHNLKDPPTSNSEIKVIGECYPGGGVVRTGLLAMFGVQNGAGKTYEGCCAMSRGEYRVGAKEAVNGMLWALAGVGAWVDLPLSAVGDLITGPIAYARHKEYPWATRWGEKSSHIMPTQQPSIPTVDQAAIDALNKPPN